MSNQVNTQSQNNQYFNLHLEGFANLYDVREVKPKPGQKWKPYVSVRAAFLQGQADSAEPVFVDLQVVGTHAKRVIEQFWDAINGDQKVSAAIKAGDLRFTAAEQDPKPGEARRVFIGARLLSVKYLQVKDAEGNCKKYDQAALDVISGANEGLADDTPLATYAKAVLSAKATLLADSMNQGDNLPQFISFDPETEDFNTRRAELEASGYAWDKSRGGFSLKNAA